MKKFLHKETIIAAAVAAALLINMPAVATFADDALAGEDNAVEAPEEENLQEEPAVTPDAEAQETAEPEVPSVVEPFINAAPALFGAPDSVTPGDSNAKQSDRNEYLRYRVTTDTLGHVGFMVDRIENNDVRYFCSEPWLTAMSIDGAAPIDIKGNSSGQLFGVPTASGDISAWITAELNGNNIVFSYHILNSGDTAHAVQIGTASGFFFLDVQNQDTQADKIVYSNNEFVVSKFDGTGTNEFSLTSDMSFATRFLGPRDVYTTGPDYDYHFYNYINGNIVNVFSNSTTSSLNVGGKIQGDKGEWKSPCFSYSWTCDVPSGQVVTRSVNCTVKSIQEITADDVTLSYGDTDGQIIATTNGDGTLSYEVTEGNDIISVDNTGKITALLPGTATVKITASATQRSYEASKEIEVTVNPVYTEVSIDYCNGEEDEVLRVDASQSLQILLERKADSMTYEERSIIGWYLDNDYAEEYDITRPVGLSAFRIYAKWTELTYTFVEGADSVWTQGGKEDLVFRVSRNVGDAYTFGHFEGVLIDDGLIDAANYTAESGSVIVKLKPGYLNTLSSGEHTITVTFDDGNKATAKFSVATVSPQTGEGAGSWMLIAASAIALCGAFALGKSIKTRKNEQ